jgi:hypothetical protein
MNHARRFRLAFAWTLVPLLLAACGDGADPDAAATKQAALDAATNPDDVQLRRKAVDPATAALARWSPVGTLPLVPVSMANLPDGKVLMWSAEDRFAFNTARGRTYFATFDPANGSVTARLVSETGHDMFCPGTAYLADGRLRINGGIDAGSTSRYDPATGAWSSSGRMNITRGHNSSTPLQDGAVLTLGGSWSGGTGNRHGEVWSPSTGAWRRLPGVPVTPFLQAGTLWGSDSHMWLIPAGNGRVLQAAMAWIDPAGNGAIQPVGPRGDDADAVTGITVMHDTGRILNAGGMTGIGGDNTASRASYVIDVNGGVAVRKVGAINYARTVHNSVVLPNGQVVIVGGQTRGVGFSNDFAVLPAEIFDPISETFTTLPAMTRPRNYHGIAVLLPDGRVMSAGGGLCGATTFAAIPIASLRGTAPPSAPSNDGLRAECFSGVAPGAAAAIVTRDESVDVDRETSSPATGVPADNFSARWTGTVRAEQRGAFRLRTVSDDGVRLWVNGQLPVDRWNDHAPTTDDSVALNLVAGQRYDVRLEYHERGSGAVMRLHWLRPGQTLWEPIPAYVLRPPGATP